MHLKYTVRALTTAILLGLMAALAHATSPATSAPSTSAPAPAPAARPLLTLGPGDEVGMRVFGQPSMDGSLYVGDDGSVRVPLAGAVMVAGLSPSQAARKVEAALRKGQFLVDPHVTFTVLKSRSQEVSVLGEVHKPGIYTVVSNTTLLDLLAQAGGTTETGSDTVYIIRAGANGSLQRLPINLEGLANAATTPVAAEFTLRGGDQVYVPRAAVFYVTGEVHSPATYRLEPNTTVLQAIARAGGVTEKGSLGRIDIRRRGSDGRYRVISAKPTDEVEPNDLITVKERIF